MSDYFELYNANDIMMKGMASNFPFDLYSTAILHSNSISLAFFEKPL